MTAERIWLDPAAEAEFWRLMRDYEDAHRRSNAPAGLAGLMPAALRRRMSGGRLEAIQAKAQGLVERFSVAAPLESEAAAKPDPAAPASDLSHPVLRIAATLANDARARETRSAQPATGTATD